MATGQCLDDQPSWAPGPRHQAHKGPDAMDRTSIKSEPQVTNKELTIAQNMKYKLYVLFRVFGRFPAELGPETPLIGSGSKNGAERTHH